MIATTLLSKTLNTRDNPWAKIALLVDSKGNKTYWDVLDKDHESVPKELKIPNFKVENAVHLVTIDGKKYDLNNLPENLKVSGNLNLRNTPITSLPAGLQVDGYLSLEGTKITELPAGLQVDGYLYLYGTAITSLPAGLTVGGGLSLRGTPITSLPAGLQVDGYLDLRDTPITSLPDDLNVEDKIYVDDPAKIQCSDEIRKKLTPMTSSFPK